MMYSYPFTLCRRAVVATFDLSAANLDLLSIDHWLSDARNVLVLRLTEPSWEGAPAAPVSASWSPLATWKTEQVAQFLESSDMRGPATFFRTNAVNGEDFESMTLETLVQELRMTPFAARKVLRARDGLVRNAH